MGRRSRARKARRQLQLVTVDTTEPIAPGTAAEGTGTLVIESQPTGPSLSLDTEGSGTVLPAVAAAARFVDEGLRHHQAGELAKAIDAYRKAVEDLPAYAELRNNLGAALMDFGEVDEAIDVLEMAVTLKPDLAQAFKNLGDAWLKKGDPTRALEQYTTAVTLKPNDPFGLLGLAISLRAMNRPEDAVTVLQGALVIAPDFLPLHHELGITFREQGAWDWAADAFERLVNLDPGNPVARRLLAVALLTGGRWARGFDQLHHAMMMTGAARADLDVPLWTGESLRGRRILLWSGGGVGETLMMLRYAQIIEESGGSVHAAVSGPMVSLVEKACGLDCVSDLRHLGPDMGNLPSDVDVHAPFGLLPALMDTRVECVPSWVTCIGNARKKVEAGAMRVGLVWSGMREHGDDPSSSLPPSGLLSLLDVTGVGFVSLQMEETRDDPDDRDLVKEALRVTGLTHEAETPSFAATHNAETSSVAALSRAREAHLVSKTLPDLGSACNDFSDLAQVMEGLDLVISVDAAPAHLAGALGIPVWVLLAESPDWHWLADREESPWYPSARLFRRRRGAPVSEVISEVRQALEAEAERLKADRAAADV